MKMLTDNRDRPCSGELKIPCRLHTDIIMCMEVSEVMANVNAQPLQMKSINI